MAYLLLMRDLSGRGYKAIHEFAEEQKRDEFVLNELLDADCEPDDAETIIFQLSNGDSVEIGRIAYQYI
jgi:hypothetical protein